MNTPGPFHRGEKAAQARYGKQDRMQRVGSVVIRDFMPDQHREFFAQLPYIFYGAVDDSDQPWAAMLVGEPGFTHSPDATHLQISASPLAGDPVHGTLREGSDIGLLGIEFATRRRNRVNGRVITRDGSMLTINVVQSFGNCPKYIQGRKPHRRPRAPLRPGVKISRELSAGQRNLVSHADTFFIASYFNEGGGTSSEGVDVSHRGGRPGFVRVDGRRTLTWPDYAGNFHFNTLGNLALNPRCSLLFIDFESGSLLYLAGIARITWEGSDVDIFPGAERLVSFDIEQVISARNAIPFGGWTAPDYSRFLHHTGSWDEIVPLVSEPT